ncbi:dynein light chain Tctex-type 3 isoform X2 [Pelecanus crispus]|uniref:dynein light chain Tctex-type 3 isoform X2 n=1 Tax=Pelecanus crispus TaxID=36300 RepID=UPI003F5D4A65
MEEFRPHNDEMIFNADEAHNIVKECIESVLGKADYNHNKVNQWTAAIVEQSLTHLVKLGKTYKYIGQSRNAACYWSVDSESSQPVLLGNNSHQA